MNQIESDLLYEKVSTTSTPRLSEQKIFMKHEAALLPIRLQCSWPLPKMVNWSKLGENDLWRIIATWHMSNGTKHNQAERIIYI